MITAAAGFLAKSALMQSPIGGMIKRIPRWAWIALALAAVIAAALIWHGRQVRATIAAAEARGEARANVRNAAAIERLRAKAVTIARKVEVAAGKINAQLKEQHDEEVRAIGARADDLRLRGPGAAATRCGPGNPAGVPGAANRPDQAGRRADDPGPAMPAGDRASVPWGWLVDRAERCDINRAEVLTWRAWHAQQAAAWEEYRRQLQAAAAKGTKGPAADGR